MVMWRLEVSYIRVLTNRDFVKLLIHVLLFDSLKAFIRNSNSFFNPGKMSIRGY